MFLKRGGSTQTGLTETSVRMNELWNIAFSNIVRP